MAVTVAAQLKVKSPANHVFGRLHDADILIGQWHFKEI